MNICGSVGVSYYNTRMEVCIVQKLDNSMVSQLADGDGAQMLILRSTDARAFQRALVGCGQASASPYQLR